MNPQATAGRIVHYYAAEHQDAPRAAIVNVDTAPDGLAELTLFAAVHPLVYTGVKYSEEPTSGCWSWMPYQKEKAQTSEGNVSESAEPRPPDELPAWLDGQLERLTKGLNDRFDSLETSVARIEKVVVPVPDIGRDRPDILGAARPGPQEAAPAMPGAGSIGQDTADDGGGGP